MWPMIGKYLLARLDASTKLPYGQKSLWQQESLQTTLISEPLYSTFYVNSYPPDSIQSNCLPKVRSLVHALYSWVREVCEWAVHDSTLIQYKFWNVKNLTGPKCTVQSNTITSHGTPRVLAFRGLH